MLKRYLVFAGNRYYPGGGWQDYKANFDTVEEAKDFLLKLAMKETVDWYQIVDTTRTEDEAQFVWNNDD